MRKHVFIASALGTVLMSASAFAAAATDTGAIKSIDAAKMIITLADGKSFEASKGFDLKPFKVGEKVVVKFDDAKKMGSSYVLGSMAAAS